MGMSLSKRVNCRSPHQRAVYYLPGGAKQPHNRRWDRFPVTHRLGHAGAISRRRVRAGFFSPPPLRWVNLISSHPKPPHATSNTISGTPSGSHQPGEGPTVLGGTAGMALGTVLGRELGDGKRPPAAHVLWRRRGNPGLSRALSWANFRPRR